MSLRVEDCMTRRVVTVEPGYSVRYAARLMKLYGISSLVVVSEGRIVGIVTERDIAYRVVARGLNPERVRVRDIMSHPVIVTYPSTPLEEAVEAMFRRGIKKLPVVNRSGEGSKLVGILSLTDVARLQPKLIEAMREAFPQAFTEGDEFYVT